MIKYNNLVKLYKKGFNFKQIAQMSGLSEKIVSTKLKNVGFMARPWRKYFVNDNAFSKYNNESCYWAGFLAADGCISGTNIKIGNNKISLQLSSKDIDHLEKFKNFLSYKGNICKLKTRSVVKLSITSKKLVEDLKKFNIVERKTFTLKPPSLDKKYLKDFIRGYIDGDGCICVNTEKHTYSISVVGTYNILKWIKHILQNECNALNPSIRKVGNIHSIQFKGRSQFNRIVDWLYYDVKVYMDRKYKKSLLGAKCDNDKFVKEQVVINLYNSGHSIRYIIQNTEFKYFRVYRILTEAGIKIRNTNKKHISENKIAKIKGLREKGETIKKISKVVNVSMPKISELLRG